MKNRLILDENYMLDPVSGELRFFKNKGFTRAEPVPGEPAHGDGEESHQAKETKSSAEAKGVKAEKKKLSEGDKAVPLQRQAG